MWHLTVTQDHHTRSCQNLRQSEAELVHTLLLIYIFWILLPAICHIQYLPLFPEQFLLLCLRLSFEGLYTEYPSIPLWWCGYIYCFHVITIFEIRTLQNFYLIHTSHFPEMKLILLIAFFLLLNCNWFS